MWKASNMYNVSKNLFEHILVMQLKFSGSYSGATYPCVPNTRVETCPPALSDPSFASPKSETLAWKFLSKRMLLLLKSL